MKQIIISFDEKGTSVFLVGNPTRSEVIGMLELSKQTMLKDVVLPVTTDAIIKKLEKSKKK